MIRFACPNCQFNLAAPEEKCGATATCPRCRQPVLVPVTASLSAEPQPTTESPESVGSHLVPEATPLEAPEAIPVNGSGSIHAQDRSATLLDSVRRNRKLLVIAAAAFGFCFISGIAYLVWRPTSPATSGVASLPAKTTHESVPPTSAEKSPPTLPSESKPKTQPKRAKQPTDIVLTDKPLLVLDADGHTSIVKRVFFTPDQQQVVSIAQDKTIRIWDLASGETVRLFRPPIGDGGAGILHAGAISPDGRWLVAAGSRPGGLKQEAGPIYIISLETGQLDDLLLGGYANVVDLAFSLDGKLLAAGTGEHDVRIYDFTERRLLRTLTGAHQAPVQAVAFSPDNQRLASVSRDGTAAFWNVGTGARMALQKAHTGQADGVSWSNNGKIVATGGSDGVVRLWDPAGNPLKTFANLRPYRIAIVSVTFTPDSRQILCTGMGQGVAFVLDLESGQQQNPATPHSGTVMHSSLSKDGKLAVSAAMETLVWRTDTGAVQQRLQGKGQTVWAVGWSADGRTIAWGNTSTGNDLTSPLQRSFQLDTLEFGERPSNEYRRAVRSGKGMNVVQRTPTLLLMQPPGGPVRSLQIPDAGDHIYCYSLLANDRVVVGTHFGLHLVDISRAQPVSRVLRGHAADVVSVAPHPNGRLFATGSADQTISIWDAEKTEPLLSLFVGGSEWIAWTPEGYYAASPGGERLMGWHVNRGLESMAAYHPALQFRKSLYRPDVIAKVVAAGDVQLAIEQANRLRKQPAAPANVAQVLPPEVSITSPAEPGGNRTSRSTIEVKATARSVGKHPVTALRLIVNGRPYGGLKGIVHFNPPKLGEVRNSWMVELPPGKHTLAVQADSPVSRGLSSLVEVVRTGGGQSILPNLYVLAVGVSEYPDPLRLNYAASDADLISRALREQQGKAFQKVEVNLIQDRAATRTKILDGIKWLRDKMTPQDVGVIFLSGHGMRDREGAFYFLPVDVDLKNPSGSSLSGEQMKPILAETPGRVMLMLDACHSGAASAVGGNARGLADNLVRDLVTDDYGVIVFSSSLGNEESLEGPATKAGYFTFAFTEGLKGPADLNQDSYIHLTEIDLYTCRRVPQLSADGQHPIITRPPSIRSFPLGRR